jgi:hypothetical protein
MRYGVCGTESVNAGNSVIMIYKKKLDQESLISNPYYIYICLLLDGPWLRAAAYSALDIIVPN